jgi:hypothetical protein
MILVAVLVRLQHSLFALLQYGLAIKVIAWKLYTAVAIVAAAILIYILLKYDIYL